MSCELILILVGKYYYSFEKYNNENCKFSSSTIKIKIQLLNYLLD